MRKPAIATNVTQKRREQLAQLMDQNSAFVLVAHPEYTRNSSVHHLYRADSNMVYLTGFEEPGSVFIFRPGCHPETVMFVRKKDPIKETWDGFRFGIEMTQEHFKIDQCYHAEDFIKESTRLLSEVDQIYYTLDYNIEFDEDLHDVLEAVNKKRKKDLEVKSTAQLMGSLRVVKDEYSIAQMRQAAEISAIAHQEVMKLVKPDINERALQGVFVRSIMEQGATREAYNSIMATGNNATTLHYVFNDCVCQNGDMFLIDAGAEFNYHAGDITRTYPVNGKFNEAQKRVYSKLLILQKKLIEHTVVGSSFKQINKITDEGLVEIMLEESLLKGSKEELLASGDYRNYYAHSAGHGLGMDVHDVGFGRSKDKSQTFEAGMCITIEPGLYIPQSDTSAPAELRGLGIRIEDNIHITADGPENMTLKAPKEIDELEALIGSGY